MPTDERGKGSKTLVEPEVTEFLVETIEKLPKYISHYARSKDKNDNSILYILFQLNKNIYIARDNLQSLIQPSKLTFTVHT